MVPMHIKTAFIEFISILLPGFVLQCHESRPRHVPIQEALKTCQANGDSYTHMGLPRVVFSPSNPAIRISPSIPDL